MTAALRRGLQESGRVGEEEVALLCQILDLPGASEPLTRLSPEVRQSRTFALLRHLILQAARRRPLVLVVENLHWIDATSDAWLTSLVECLAGARLLLVVTARPEYRLLCRLWLGQAQERTGRLGEALTQAERALALACAHQERSHQAYALRLLGGIETSREPSAQVRAEAHYRAALTLAEELGMRPLAAHCHLGLGMLYAASGRPAEAHLALSAAVESYRALEMTWWLPPAELDLAQVKEM